MSSSLKPLETTLESILGRLAFLESKAGIEVTSTTSQSATAATAPPAVTSAATDDDEIAPSLQAYDEHIQKSLTPFINTCKSIDGLKETGPNIQTIWESIRIIIDVGTKCKKPSDVPSALMSFLKPIQKAVGDIRKARLDRKFDYHIKGIMELLTCVSWVVMSAPPAPSSFIKDTVGASEYWTNKIRREYKGKDEVQIAFCDTMKALILDLSAYVKQYHLSGLMWNAKGVAIEDYKGGASTSSSSTTSTTTATTTTTTTSRAPAVSGGDIMKELAKKRTGDGNSAATGLKKVSREQQTWRKEYNASGSAAAAPAPAPTTGTVKPSQIKAAQKTVVKKEPVCKFQTLGSKWVVEYQTKSSNANGVCMIEIQNPKEQVYIYKCEDTTIQIKGKLKSVILDTCTKTNLVFDTAISSCEVVNCKRVQIQATGICPSFAIDKTDGCLTYLSEEAVSISNFVTSKSTEMNVSWPDSKSGEMKEAPIPEQFVHRLSNNVVTSEVSDLYH